MFTLARWRIVPGDLERAGQGEQRGEKAQISGVLVCERGYSFGDFGGQETPFNFRSLFASQAR